MVYFSVATLDTKTKSGQVFNFNLDKWFYQQREDITWRPEEYEQYELANRQNIESATTPDDKAKQFFKSQSLVVYSDEQRQFYGQVAKNIIESPFFVEKLSKAQKAQALLFVDWEKLSDDIKLRLEQEYGEPLYDNSVNIVPTLYVNQTEMEYCGEMEVRMMDSRERVLIGERLLLKMHGTDAMITDKLTITKQGNIILPYTWYYPDQYFVETMQKRHEQNQGSMTHQMDDFPMIGLQVVRNSPAFAWDEGWDNPKHKDIFHNLHDPENGLSKLIDTVKK